MDCVFVCIFVWVLHIAWVENSNQQKHKFLDWKQYSSNGPNTYNYGKTSLTDHLHRATTSLLAFFGSQTILCRSNLQHMSSWGLKQFFVVLSNVQIYTGGGDLAPLIRAWGM